jgi:hypothetical protein
MICIAQLFDILGVLFFSINLYFLNKYKNKFIEKNEKIFYNFLVIITFIGLCVHIYMVSNLL